VLSKVSTRFVITRVPAASPGVLSQSPEVEVMFLITALAPETEPVIVSPSWNPRGPDGGAVGALSFNRVSLRDLFVVEIQSSERTMFEIRNSCIYPLYG
jgi:hypothetical protein